MKVDLDVCKTEKEAWTPTYGFGVAGGESLGSIRREREANIFCRTSIYLSTAR